MLGTLITIGFALGPLSPLPPLADYIFQVPIRIENMRHVTSADVSCGIIHVSAEFGRVTMHEPTSGRVEVPIRDGAFTGTVTARAVVTATTLARYTPSEWFCNLIYWWRNPDGTLFHESLDLSERAPLYTRLTGQEIATDTTSIRGTMPPP